MARWDAAIRSIWRSRGDRLAAPPEAYSKVGIGALPSVRQVLAAVQAAHGTLGAGFQDIQKGRGNFGPADLVGMVDGIPDGGFGAG